MCGLLIAKIEVLQSNTYWAYKSEGHAPFELLTVIYWSILAVVYKLVVTLVQQASVRGNTRSPVIWGNKLPSEATSLHLRQQAFIWGSKPPSKATSLHLRQQASIWGSKPSSKATSLHPWAYKNEGDTPKKINFWLNIENSLNLFRINAVLVQSTAHGYFKSWCCF